MLQVAETLIQRLSAFFAVWSLEKNTFFYLLFGCPTANFGSWSWNSLSYHILIVVLWHSWPVDCQEPTYKVGSLNTIKSPLWVEPGSFRFHCNVVTHSKLPLACNFKPWLLDSFDLLSCSSELRKIYTMTPLMICLAVFSK